MEVAKFGYRELRIVKGDNWTLPVFCDPYTSDARTVTHWAVRPAIQLLAAPFTELSKRFAPLNMSNESTFWIIEAENIDKLTERVTGCVPEEYMSWTSEMPGKESNSLELVKANDKDEEFLRFFCDRSCIDKPLARYVWRAIKEGMQHWLINMQKPISFELFTIYPIPFRANWKEIQLSKHLSCYKIFKLSRKRWHTALIKSGFIQDLGSTDLVSMNKDKTFNWNLEIVPSRLWNDSVREAEKIRLSTKRPIKYANYYESCIRRRLDDIITTFSTWVNQVRISVAVLRESTNGSGNVLVPGFKSKAVSPNKFRPSVTYFQVAPDAIRLVKGQTDRPKKVSKTLRQMYALSGLPSALGDLRQRKKPSNVGGGTSGLLLPNANESPVGEERLLAEGERAEQ